MEQAPKITQVPLAVHEEQEIDILLLLRWVESSLGELKSVSGNAFQAQQILSCYNALREAFDVPSAPSIEHIDCSWLQWQHYQLWKEGTQEEFLSNGIDCVAEQHYYVTQVLESSLEKFNNDPETDYDRIAIYCYSFLRELAGFGQIDDIAESVLSIDMTWLRAYDYELWKKQLDNSWQTEGICELEDKCIALAGWCEDVLDKLKKATDNLGISKEALYTYNYLRELLALAAIDTISSIDEDWVKAQHYHFWKERFKKAVKQEGQIELTEQQLLLMGMTEDALAEYSQDSEDRDAFKQAIHAYNYLQEIAKKPLVSSVCAIDGRWLKENAYHVWKQLMGELWMEIGITQKHIQRYNLALWTEEDLEELRKDPNDKYQEKETLYKYNLLRELSSLTCVDRAADISVIWLKQIREQLSHTL